MEVYLLVSLLVLEEAIGPQHKRERLSLWEKVNKLNGDFNSISELAKKSILKQIVKSVVSYKDGSLEIELYEV